VWTGSQALIWGGHLGNNRAYLYDPDLDSWTAGSGTGAPGAREHNTAVWTGSQMIVWGGSGYNIESRRGGVYDPASDTWELTTLEGAPTGRIGHSAVWAVDQMVVWGGQVNNSPFNGFTRTGGRFRFADPGAAPVKLVP
jgi:N-acetylneuraminic acid mutarotase